MLKCHLCLLPRQPSLNRPGRQPLDLFALSSRDFQLCSGKKKKTTDTKSLWKAQPTTQQQNSSKELSEGLAFSQGLRPAAFPHLLWFLVVEGGETNSMN